MSRAGGQRGESRLLPTVLRMADLETLRVRLARPALRAYPFQSGRWRLSRALLGGTREHPIPHETVARAIPAGRVARMRGGSALRLRNDVMHVAPYLYGDYEPALSQVFRALVRPRDTVFDIGANFGWYTILFARSIGRAGSVHAFEPLAELMPIVEDALSLNRHEGAVHVNNVGLGSRSGPLTVHTFSGLPHGHASASDLGRDDAEPHDCRVETLDAYVSRTGTERVDVIKIDVEGHEREVLRGGERTLSQLSPVISFEVNPVCLHHAGVAPDELREALVGLGYRHFWRLRPRGGAESVSGRLASEHGDYLAAKPQDRARLAAATGSN